MKNNAYYILAFWALFSFSCGSKSSQEASEVRSSVETAPETLTPQMQRSSVTRETELNGKPYHFTILREPDPELPQVTLKDGTFFTDNRIELVIDQGTSELMRRTFTKKDFSNVVSPRFLDRVILEGLVYDRIEKGKFLFAASVCVPHTDLYILARVLISPQGSLTFEKEDSMDDTLDLELQGSEE